MRPITRKVAPRLLAAIALFPAASWSQTVPTELLELSIEDLFDTNIIDDRGQSSDQSKWHLELAFTSSAYDEYYINGSKVTYDDVLFSPGQEARTDKNYPVVPTMIRQEITALQLAYDLSEDITLRGQIPLVHQSTDHISIIPGYDEFNISSNGLGDVVLLADTVLSKTINSVWRIGGGVSFPTGSIDEEGDTPRAPGNQQLPYTMQLGSGTWDFPILLSYQKYEESFTWGLEGQARIRTGKNDRDYRLGNTYSAGSWVERPVGNNITLGIRADYLSRGKIRGNGDESLRVPVPGFPYPAPVVDPDAFGGDQIDASVYLTAEIADDWRLRIRYERPLWLDLNGPQTALHNTVAVSLSTNF